MMKSRVAFCLLGLGAGAAGCNLAATATRNLCSDTMVCADDVANTVEFGKLAGEAWKEVVAGCSQTTRSVDYERGFKAGYVDYLQLGESRCGPTVPPLAYRSCCYESPAGRQAVADWFAGFQHGAAVARQSGRREYVTVPIAFYAPAHPSSLGSEPHHSEADLFHALADKKPTEDPKIPEERQTTAGNPATH